MDVEVLCIKIVNRHCFSCHLPAYRIFVRGYSQYDILLSTTNKVQRYTVFFITVNAVHVSGGFSAHHQELKNCTHSIWYVPGLLPVTVHC
jgi:hypothetical protein